MPDKDLYPNFKALAANEREGIDYQIVIRRQKTALAVLAPHGGGIEPGTSELASALAGEQISLYLFEGLSSTGSSRLHITSTRFDEPHCLALLKEVHCVITLHGCRSPFPVVFTGGLDQSLQRMVQQALGAAGFLAYPDRRNRRGAHPRNLCNRGRSGYGLQLELSETLRRRLFSSLDPAGRKQPTPLFHSFNEALLSAVESAGW
jgi:phage replication-related protein YjqB (UPF0714/DUF867 family)